MPEADRSAQLGVALAAVRQRIAAGCAVAGRDADAVTLIAVTKTYPVTDARLLLDLGVRDFGESRAAEARDKARDLRPTAPGDHTTGSETRDDETRDDGPRHEEAVRWHFVGQLQTNKARVVAAFATAVHSLDRVALVDALDRAVAARARGPLEVFVQISLDADPRRGGVLAADLPALADRVAGTDTLRLRGVMAVAPQAMAADQAFTRLHDLSTTLIAAHPEATAISAGMSHDLESAVAHGATHVRVGSALLGRRPPIVS